MHRNPLMWIDLSETANDDRFPVDSSLAIRISEWKRGRLVSAWSIVVAAMVDVVVVLEAF